MFKKAFAKINYNLNVYEKMPTGYHFMQSYMQKVSLYDELSFNFEADPGIEVSVKDVLGLSGKNNIIYQAAQMYFEKSGIQPSLKVGVKKNIFIAAGMAGGSSNAGATLCALNEHYQIFSFGQLLDLAEQLGSDVPFFLYPEDLMYVEGRGVVCKAEKSMQSKPMLLLNPGKEVSTARIYQDLSRSMVKMQKKPYIELETREDLKSAMRRGNDMQAVAEALCPEIKQLNEGLKQSSGCEYSQMSGSGATVYGLFDTEDNALAAGKKIKKNKINVIFTWTGTSSCFKKL